MDRETGKIVMKTEGGLVQRRERQRDIEIERETDRHREGLTRNIDKERDAMKLRNRGKDSQIDKKRETDRQRQRNRLLDIQRQKVMKRET